MPEDYAPDFAKFTEATTPAENWIARQLETSRKGIEQDIANYNFAEAVDKVYHLLWDDFADWFVEASKTKFSADFASFALGTFLKLAHPFVPFITEVIWTTLNADDSLLITQEWPDELIFDAKSAEDFAKIQEFVSEIRYVLSQLPNGKYSLNFAKTDKLIRENQDLIKSLAKLKEIRETEEKTGLRIAVHGREAWLDISDELIYEHQQNLEKRLLEFRENLTKLEARLANKGYIERAPKELVDETRDELAKIREQIKRLVAELEA
jgi:valyl-tRNA synthetase